MIVSVAQRLVRRYHNRCEREVPPRPLPVSYCCLNSIIRQGNTAYTNLKKCCLLINFLILLLLIFFTYLQRPMNRIKRSVPID